MVLPPVGRASLLAMPGCLILLSVLATAGSAAGGMDETTADGDAGGRRHCGFIEGTLVPRLVMGVRRVQGPDIKSLVVRKGLAPDDAVVATLPLFRPYYVVDQQAGPDGHNRLLIQDGYAADRPLGWANGDHVEPFRSRYAYTFAPRERPHTADLHGTSQASYERLLGQQKGDRRAAEDLVLIRERQPKGIAPWNPATIDDLVPFIELRLPGDAIEPEYPDTTPTFKFGIRDENRIVHMGVICGGPSDGPLPQGVNGLEMVFVVDETESMKPFFEGVAKLVESVGKVAAQQRGEVKLAVCYYTDGPPGTRVTATPLRPIKSEKDAAVIGGEIRNHEEKLPPGDFAFPPERMLEGLRDSIRKAKFTPGARVFVAVVGDTGHEPGDVDAKAALISEVADLIEKCDAHVFFAHVGRRVTEHDKLFEKDAQAVRRAVVKLGLPEERVIYQSVEGATLAQELSKAEQQAADRRMQRLESRSPYAEPGPELLRQLAAAGVTPTQYESQRLQFYVPSRGWLFHPISDAGGQLQAPQFRELFFMSPVEQRAINDLFEHLQEELVAGRIRIDHDATLIRFARALADAAGAPGLAGLVQREWRRIPSERRSLGVFLEDVFGLRLKAALPYPVEQPTSQAATVEEVNTLKVRISRLRQHLSRHERNAVWFDASILVP